MGCKEAWVPVPSPATSSCVPEQMMPFSVTQFPYGGVMGIILEQQSPNFRGDLGWSGEGKEVLQGSPWR